MQFIWSHCYNNELYILYSKAQDMYVSWKLSDLAGTRLNYVVTKLLEINCTSAKEQQPQITNYSHSQMATKLIHVLNFTS